MNDTNNTCSLRFGTSGLRGLAEVLDGGPALRFGSRGVSMLDSGALGGFAVGVYQHSSAMRDILVDVLRAVGAQAPAFGRSDIFVPVDTEALRPEDLELCRFWANEHAPTR